MPKAKAPKLPPSKRLLKQFSGTNILDTPLESWDVGEIVMLSVFGDESHDSKKARVFAVGALLGDAATWDGLRSKWTERTHGVVFHAADCESGYGDFKHVSEDDRLRLHRDLTSILAESRVFGIGIAVDLEGARVHFHDVIQSHPDMPFYDCFFHALLKTYDMAAHFIPPEKVELTFDQHREVQYNAALLYQWLSENRPVIATEKISFATRKEPGIQAADLWARELMKRADSLLRGGGGSARPQWSTLKSTDRFKAELHTGKYFEAMRHQEDEVLERAGFCMSAYEEWRQQKGVVDNLSNRFTYVATLDHGPLGVFREAPGAIIRL